MKSLRSSGKQRKPRFLLRQVVGESMHPTLAPNVLVVALRSRSFRYKPGQVVVIEHNGLEKIKRISALDSVRGVFVLGDNQAASTDSRHFGWLDADNVIARVIWPRMK